MRITTPPIEYGDQIPPSIVEIFDRNGVLLRRDVVPPFCQIDYGDSLERSFGMKIFGQIVRTVVNVATLPVSVAKDVVLAVDGNREIGQSTRENLERLKDEAQED